MTARPWPCHCRPVLAVGHFRGTRLVYAIHGINCDQPLHRRTTLCYTITPNSQTTAQNTST
jgi:hypothetical protein